MRFRNVNQWTPLDFASAEGHADVVKYLLSEDVPVNPMDKEKVHRYDVSTKSRESLTLLFLLKDNMH